MRRPEAPLLAVDAGASKTDAVLLERSGRVVAAVRLARSGSVGIRQPDGFDAVRQAVELAMRQAGIVPNGTPLAQIGVYCLAGVDLPVDYRHVTNQLKQAGWSALDLLRNDTFAVLRAGSELGWGIAVTCGSGMNCVGVAADGRVVRFPALGPLSGDFASGGGWLGIAALGAAMRGRDGRGLRTSLEQLVPRHFGLARPVQVVEAFYARRLPQSRLLELAPLVFRAAGDGDEASRGLLDLLADEIVAMATSALRRLRLTSQRVDVILGGGNFRNDDPVFSGRVCAGIRAMAPGAGITVLDVPPIAGAALLAFDRAGASPSAKSRVRAELTHGRMTRAALDSGRLRDDAARLPHQ